MTPLRWGLSLSLSEELAEPAEVARLAALAEDAGWNGVFVWDHLWNRTASPFADAWLTLAAVAAATDHVRIGPLVTPLPRRRPQVVAQQATTLDRMSGGRLVLGLGLGTDSYGEFSEFDEPARDDSLRARDLDRGIELLLPALAGAPVPQIGGPPDHRSGHAATALSALGCRTAGARGGSSPVGAPRPRRPGDGRSRRLAPRARRRHTSDPRRRWCPGRHGRPGPRRRRPPPPRRARRGQCDLDRA